MSKCMIEEKENNSVQDNLLQSELFDERELKAESKVEFKRYMACMPTCFIICPLPIRSTGPEKPIYEKKYNNYKMQLQGSHGIPGGKIARNILMMITTAAKVFKSENVNEKNEKIIKPVDIKFESLKEFANIIGVENGDGLNNAIDILEKYNYLTLNFNKNNYKKDQWFEGMNNDGTNNSIKDENGYYKVRSRVNIPFFNKMEDVKYIKNKHKRGEAIKVEIQLSQQFVDMAKENSSPIDYNVYKEIRSTVEKDIYTWLVYRVHKLAEFGNRDGLFISRENLLKQFGDDENKGNEKMKYLRIIEAIREIKKKYYTDIKCSIIERGRTDEKGIVLFQSPLVINEKDLRYVPLISLY